MEDKPYKAYSVLKNIKSDIGRYKFAIACQKLKKYKEGEKCLLKSSQVPPNGGYGYHLLAQLCEKQRKYQEAQQYYQKSLELNPALWQSYENSCKLGDQLLPSKVFIDDNFKKSQ